MRTSPFPSGFLIGAATAAHQVEGNNTHSDFWAIEQDPNQQSFAEPSLAAVDHYNRYAEDIALLAAAGLNAYRFSIEWARIEPEPGRFDSAAIQHYREVLDCCHRFGVTPVVTLHHFSSPRWLITEGGWEAESTVERFASYCGQVATELGDLMEWVCTINEANMGLQLYAVARDMAATMMPGSVQVGAPLDLGPLMARSMAPLSHLFGNIEPGRIAHFLTPRTLTGNDIIGRAHQAGRAAIKAARPELKVGWTLSLHAYQAEPGAEASVRAEQDAEFGQYLQYMDGDDFVGVQNYTRKRVGAEGVLPPPEGAELTQMGYEFYPAALAQVVREVAAQWQGPILVTEHGIATGDDTRRVAFIDEGLGALRQCLADGVDVRGYLHWSLLDNFEWMLGFSRTFGLIAVDRATQARHPKPSLARLGAYSPRPQPTEPATGEA